MLLKTVYCRFTPNKTSHRKRASRVKKYILKKLAKRKKKSQKDCKNATGKIRTNR